MIKTFTQTDLIRYLYQETTETENREIDRALLCDTELKALFDELRGMQKTMNEEQLQPSAATVLNILSYSKSLEAKRTR